MIDYESIAFNIKRTESTNRVLAYFVLNIEGEPHFQSDIRQGTDLPRGNVSTILNHLTDIELIIENDSDSFYSTRLGEEIILLPRPEYRFPNKNAYTATVSTLLTPYLPQRIQRIKNTSVGRSKRPIMLPPRPRAL